MIIGITGLVIDAQGKRGSAGAGKSTVADRLVNKFSFCQVGMADPMKRFLMDLFDWPAEVLFGETEKKNVPDKRYCIGYRDTVTVDEIAEMHQASKGLSSLESKMLWEQRTKEITALYLTPRLACQKLGKAMRECYPDIWCVKGMRVAKELLHTDATLHAYYRPEEGIRYNTGGTSKVKGVCFSDIRFKNELAVIKREGGKVIRVVRPVEELFISNEHESENDLNDVPDEEFDYILHGKPKDVPDLQLKTDEMMEMLCLSK